MRHNLACSDLTRRSRCGIDRCIERPEDARNSRELHSPLAPTAASAAAGRSASEVLDHRSDDRPELDTRMTENFHIGAKATIPVAYREVA